MVEQQILIDNDALLKLARYCLLDEAVTVLNSSPVNVTVLSTAKYSLFPAQNRLKFCREEDSASRLEAFLKTSQPLDSKTIYPDILDALNAIENIDSGEASLFAAGATNKDAFVVTGDKRSLAALCAHDSVADVYHALAGRVISMEVLFWLLTERYEFTFIQERVRARPDVDKTLQIVFGVYVAGSFESIQQGLSSYIRNLYNNTGSLIYMPFS